MQGESNSISNQKEFLSNYAREHGYINLKHYTDDGFSGRNFNRPAIKELLKDVEDGKVGTVIVKDYCAIILMITMYRVFLGHQMVLLDI